ncbi:MAG TPA: restriction endonuclease [Chloroflexi bacterium]|nr:restriction endonuclease [Chloroflexota bacterium]
MRKDFEEWFKNFKNDINGYKYYTDFPKIIANVERIKIELNILNSLVGSKDIERDFENIIQLYPETLKCIPLLLAVRSNEISAQDHDGGFDYKFDKMNCSIEQYKNFCRKTGLFDLISNHIVNNLVDYALGIETGLDSNARKNRGGAQMEALVESYLQKAGFIKEIDFFVQEYLNKAILKWGINLPGLDDADGARKRYDFVLHVGHQVYGIETNFYASSGSKLNETARSYQLLGQQSLSIEGFTFVWITDGCGWKGAKANLKETYNSLETVYNINDLENGMLSRILRVW